LFCTKFSFQKSKAHTRGVSVKMRRFFTGCSAVILKKTILRELTKIK
jgi:hypothetical protein